MVKLNAAARLMATKQTAAPFMLGKLPDSEMKLLLGKLPKLENASRFKALLKQLKKDWEEGQLSGAPSQVIEQLSEIVKPSTSFSGYVSKDLSSAAADLKARYQLIGK